jgi:hypothetical protein
MNDAAPRLSRNRKLSELISAAFDFYVASPATLFIIATPAVLITLLTAVLSSLTSSDLANSLLSLLTLPLGFVVYQLIAAGIVAALLEIDAGRSVAPGAAFNTATARLDELVGAAFRSTVIIFLFFITIVGIPWAIVRAVRWAFISQAIMIDGQTSATALDYSASFVRGQGWRTAGRLIGVGIVFGIPVAILAGAVDAALPNLAGSLIEGLFEAAFVPLTVTATTLIYYDLKLRRPADVALPVEDLAGESP